MACGMWTWNNCTRSSVRQVLRGSRQRYHTTVLKQSIAAFVCTTTWQNSLLQLPWKQMLPRSWKAAGQTADQQKEEVKADGGIVPSKTRGNGTEGKTKGSHFSLEERTRISSLEFWSHWWGNSRPHMKSFKCSQVCSKAACYNRTIYPYI